MILETDGVRIMKKEYSIEEKFKYLKYKVDHEDTSPSEKLEILEFLGHHTGLFGKELNLRIFFRELNRLTADINPKPKEK